MGLAAVAAFVGGLASRAYQRLRSGRMNTTDDDPNDMAPPPSVDLARIAYDRERRDRRQAAAAKAVVLAAAAQWEAQPETIGPDLRAALAALEQEGRAG
jgi:uncharacterized membrane protein YebE (DUF533 family)